MEILQPADWVRPKGYSNGTVATGRMVFVSGMIGWDAQEKIVSHELAAQVRQALSNVVAVLAEADAKPEHITRLTWYLIDKREYLGQAEQDRLHLSRDYRPPLPGDDGGAGVLALGRRRPRGD